MMRARFALTVCCLSGLAWLAICAVQANPLKDPKRLIAGQTVDLEPLFRWWTNRHGDRPLYAWAHVTGAVVATNGWGWTVEGRLDPPPRRGRGSAKERASANGQVKLALRTPAALGLEQFSEVTAQSKALHDQSRALSTLSAAAMRLREIGSNSQHSRALAVQIRQLRLVENQAKAQLASLLSSSPIAAPNWPVFPIHEVLLDCLALDMGQEVDGLPLYDYGVPLTSYRPPAPKRSRARRQNKCDLKARTFLACLSLAASAVLLARPGPVRRNNLGRKERRRSRCHCPHSGGRHGAFAGDGDPELACAMLLVRG